MKREENHHETHLAFYLHSIIGEAMQLLERIQKKQTIRVMGIDETQAVRLPATDALATTATVVMP